MKNHPILRRFMKRKASVLGAVILILFFFTALVGPFIAPHDPYEQNYSQIHKGPSAEFWFGTDYLGRDTFSRLIFGARVSLALSFCGVISGSLIGVILGVCAGYFGKWVDAVITRLIDIMLAFPSLLLAMTIVAIVTGLAIFGAVFICVTSPIGFTDALYEASSALATVGITAGATGSLSIPAQILIIIYMYFGRVGVLTISLGFLMGSKAEERYQYAHTNLLIG